MPAQDAPDLNPAQMRTLAELGAGTQDRPTFDADLATDLRSHLEDELSEVAATIHQDRPLRIDKHLLAGVHGCEVRFRSEEASPFELSIPVVRGSVVHKAVELAVHVRSAPLPLVLVDAAIDRLADSDHWAGDFLASLNELEQAEACVRRLATSSASSSNAGRH